MEFNEKLQELRKQKGITQEELAEKLYVSRTAISKWESGRGYPSIESLKLIAKFFSITVDELLSSNELLTIAEEDTKQKEKHLRNIILGLLDLGTATLLFLPFFRQNIDGLVNVVSLFSLTEIAGYIKIAYFTVIIGVVLFGVSELALQNCKLKFWDKNKNLISLILSFLGTILFIISPQPYAATFLIIFLSIKSFILIRRQ